MSVDALIKTGAEAFLSKLGGDGQLSLDAVVEALSGLLGDGEGGLDVSSLMENLDGAGLASLAQSWLGDGANEAISAGQIGELFSGDKLSAFSEQLGLAQDQAVDGLSEALPAIMDQASSGGQLLESLGGGGAGGLLGMVGKLFGR